MVPFFFLLPSWCVTVTPDAWFISLLKRGKRQNEVRERGSERQRQKDRVHLSWMNVLRIPLINAHTHSPAHVHTHVVAHSHVYPGVVSPFLSLHLTFIYSISFFFFQSRDPSRMLSHIGSSLGRAFSCSLLGCNNYSISRQCVPWLCSWAVAAGGVQWRGECWGEEGGAGCHSGTQGDAGEGVVFLAVAHPVLSGGAQSRTNELRLAY